MDTRKMTEDSDDVCILCCRSATIFAIGECDHAVCFECSTRMRVLCRQNECPICRRDMPKVVFTKIVHLFQDMHLDDLPLDPKYKIYFSDRDCQQAFTQLLEHVCKICSSPRVFRNFNLLRDHMRKEHQRFYCDICVEHLKIFTHERKTYSRQELGRHRRQGDIDDTSHRGHPLCKYCDERFLDSDELFRHLRREHYYCHFCDADGQYEYYSDYEYLREHFRTEHYLCEENHCREERFTHVFRTEIDLKAHKAQHHSRNMSKAQARQARTLELEFTFAPRNMGRNGLVGGSEFGGSNRGRRGRTAIQISPDRDEDGEMALALTASLANRSSECASSSTSCPKEVDFPLLNGSLPTKKNEVPEIDSRPNHETLAKKLARQNHFNVKESSWSAEQFPILGSSQSATLRQNAASHSPANSRKTLLLRFNSQEEFPALGGSSERRTPNVSIQVGHNHVNISTERRSSLGNGPQSINQPVPRPNIHITQNGPNSISIAQNWDDNFPSLQPSSASGKSKSASINAKANPVSDVISNSLDNKTNNSSRLSTKTSHVTIPMNWTNSRDKSPSSDSESASPGGKQKNKKNKTKPLINKKDVIKEVSTTLEPNKKKKKHPDIKNKDNLDNRISRSKTSENIIKELIVESVADQKTESVIESFVGDATNSNPEIILLDSFKEFPALPCDSSKTPPGFSPMQNRISDPPPGLTSNTSSNHRTPPGFKNSADSVNSLPQSLQLVDSNLNSTDWPLETFSSPRTYIFSQPHDFQNRNQHLIQKIREFAESEEKFNEFKILSGNYRQGNINAMQYYDKCGSILGQDNFLDIFSELVCLLPDIQKQQYLLAAHTTATKKQPQAKNPGKQFMVCATCRQVLSSKDFASHMLTHTMDNNFPSLLSTKSALSPLINSK